jgi:uncharacterized protein
MKPIKIKPISIKLKDALPFGVHKRPASSCPPLGTIVHKEISLPMRVLFFICIFTFINFIPTLPAAAQDPDKALLQAAQSGNIDQARTLILAAASPMATNAKRQTALHLAANAGHTPVVELLLEQNIKVDARDQFNRTPLMGAAAAGHATTVRLLLGAGANLYLEDLRGQKSADLAAQAGQQNLADHLHQLEQLTETDINHGLRLAVRDDNPAMVAKLLTAGADPHKTGTGGVTPLALAAEFAEAATVRMLLESGADPRVVDIKGRTPLMLAAWRHRDQVVPMLLASGGRLFLGTPASGNEAMMVAAYLGHVPSLTQGLNLGLSPKKQDRRGITPLMAAAQGGSRQAVETLLAAKADPDQRDKLGASALLRAVFWGHPDIVGLLLQAGANPDYRQNKDTDELAWPVIVVKGRQALGYLPRNLAPPTARGQGRQTALMWAARAPTGTDTASATLLLAAGAHLKAKDKHGRTALIWAADENRPELAAQLLQAGASHKTKDKDQRTALLGAAASGAVEIVRLLLAADAKVDHRDAQDNTALILAAKGGHLAVLETLLDADADPKARNEIDQSALTWARDKRHRQIYDRLLKAGARP